MGCAMNLLTCYPGCADKPMRQGCHSIIGSSGRLSRDERRALERIYAAKTRETLKGTT
jgi:hypothetical protein